MGGLNNLFKNRIFEIIIDHVSNIKFKLPAYTVHRKFSTIRFLKIRFD